MAPPEQASCPWARLGSNPFLFQEKAGPMAKERHPKELKILFFTEMWERFGFYLMIGILWQYITDSEKGGLGWSEPLADAILGSYLALVYFTPFIGGLLADRLLGYRRTIVIGAVLMMLGYFALTLPGEGSFYMALGLVILGNGAFKPNISSLVGNLYPPGSTLKEAGYNIFYMGINVGAFACNIVAAIVRNYFEGSLEITAGWKLTGWQMAFATASLGMFFGLVTFVWNIHRLAAAEPEHHGDGGNRESLTPFWLQCMVPALALGALGWFIPDLYERWTPYEFPLTPDVPAFILACLPVIVFYYSIWRNVPDAGERGRVAALLVVFSVVVIFWAIFNLNSTALTAFTRDDVDRAPGVLVKPFTDTLKPLAEDAPPSYFANADASMERPARTTYHEVDAKKYKKLQKANTPLTMVRSMTAYT
jgi:POT family proton-dependent oligopeptide transporter